MSTDHDQLRDLLQRTAPDRPELDPGTRAAAVARRGRTARLRDRGLVAGAVVAVLAAAVVVPLTLGGGDDGPDVATPSPAPTAPPCPAQPIDVGDPATVPASALDDVVAVRSCPATWDNAQPGSADPILAKPLTGDAAADFVAEVGAMPPFGIPAECATMSVMPQPWALVLTSADGEQTVLGSTMRVCGTVIIGGKSRSAEDALAAFLDRAEDEGTRGTANR